MSPPLMQLSSSSSSSAAALVRRLIPTSSSYVHRRSQVTSLSFSSPATRFSFLLSQTQLQPFPFHYKSRKRTRTRTKPVSAVFERFTERAIKAVIFSQREAKALGSDMVFTQHLLLGLIIEDNGNGFLGSGVTIDQARLSIRHIWRQPRGIWVSGLRESRFLQNNLVFFGVFVFNDVARKSQKYP